MSFSPNPNLADLGGLGVKHGLFSAFSACSARTTDFARIMRPMGRHLHIDPFGGIAGDMFLAGLIDLGAEPDAIAAAFEPLPVAGRFELRPQRVQSFGIGAVNVEVVETQPHAHDHNRPHDRDGHQHHHTTAADILKMIEQLDAAERARQRARAIVTRLAEAEARVHEMPVGKVHFHEVGALDSIVDMLGAAVGLELLGIDSVSCGVLPISRGWVRCAHGRMPVPAPATAYLLEGLATAGVDREGELVTPTGAALCAALASEYGPPPAMRLGRIGYGAGDKQFPEHPNLLRLMVGQRLSPGDLGPLSPADSSTPAGASTP
jgi:uncharacterized protein (TIGR00299 family) protein